MGKPENCYYPCDNVNIPEALLGKIFPWAWKQLEWLRVDNKKRPKDMNAPDGRDRGGEAFLEMLTTLGARSLITAAALLQDDFPRHIVFNHHIFNTDPMFHEVKRQMIAAMEIFNVMGTPASLALRAAAPEIVESNRCELFFTVEHLHSHFQDFLTRR